MEDFPLPLMTSTSAVLLCFLGAVLIFHFLLVWPRNIGKRCWKLVDYAWLSIAVLGVFGGVAANRKDAATSLRDMSSFRVAAAIDNVASAIEFGNSGAICRRFTQSEYSPPPDKFARIQDQYDLECAWFKAAKENMPSAIGKGEEVHLQDLGSIPPKDGDAFAIESLTKSLARYNSSIARQRSLFAESRETRAEETLRYLGPFLIALAIALRIAKVTGELRHDALGKMHNRPQSIDSTKS